MSGSRRLALLIAIWSVPFAIGAGSNFFGLSMSGESMPASHVIGHSAAWWYFWVPATPLVVWLGRHFSLRDGWLSALPIHVVSASLLAVAQAILIISVGLLTGHYMLHRPFPLMVLDAVASQYLFSIAPYAAILGVDYGILLLRRQRDRDLLASRLEAQLAQAQLQALRSQLQPHFLFNALNTIAMLVRGGVRDQATQVIVAFSELLRRLLADSALPTNTLARELEFTRRYLEIERIRLGDRLGFSMETTEAAKRALIPTLLLQPLVENAVRHGIAPKAQGGQVTLAADVAHDRVRIAIDDDGIGVPPGWSPRESQGVGLANTARRLERMYPDSHRFDISPRPGGGTRIAIELPFSAAAAEVPSIEAA